MPATNKNKRSISRYGRYIVFFANIGAILTLFLSTLAWVISPAKTTIFAYLGLGLGFILAINVIFLLLWLISAKWKFALVSAVSMLICSYPILTFFPIHFKSKEVPENSIKVLSYNVRGFSAFNVGRNTTYNPTLDYIKNSNADIICMQEFLAISGRKDISWKKIKKELKDYPYHSYTKLNSIYDNSSNYIYGLACFSKYPIIDTHRVDIDTRENAGSVVYKIKIKDKVVSVFNNHLESNRLTDEDKKLYRQFLTSETDSKTIDDIAHNIRKRLGSAYAKRAPQADIVNNEIKKQNTDGIIVCGDFNDTPISYTYKTIKGDLKDSFAETGFGPGITYHENFFLFRIDYIMHSKNIKAYNCSVDKVKYSDHYPIFTYLTFEE